MEKIRFRVDGQPIIQLRLARLRAIGSSKGWGGMWLDRRVNWRDVAVVVKRSYRLTAPKRVAVTVE